MAIAVVVTDDNADGKLGHVRPVMVVSRWEHHKYQWVEYNPRGKE